MLMRVPSRTNHTTPTQEGQTALQIATTKGNSAIIQALTIHLQMSAPVPPPVLPTIGMALELPGLFNYIVRSM